MTIRCAICDYDTEGLSLYEAEVHKSKKMYSWHGEILCIDCLNSINDTVYDYREDEDEDVDIETGLVPYEGSKDSS